MVALMKLGSGTINLASMSLQDRIIGDDPVVKIRRDAISFVLVGLRRCVGYFGSTASAADLFYFLYGKP